MHSRVFFRVFYVSLYWSRYYLEARGVLGDSLSLSDDSSSGKASSSDLSLLVIFVILINKTRQLNKESSN